MYTKLGKWYPGSIMYTKQNICWGHVHKARKVVSWENIVYTELGICWGHLHKARKVVSWEYIVYTELEKWYPGRI